MPRCSVLMLYVRAGHQRDQIGGDGRGGGEFPAAVAGRAGLPVPDHGPGARRGDRHGDGRLQVRLIEGGEDPLSVVQPGVQGEVRLAVGAVGEPVQARAGARVRHVRLDPQFVIFAQPGQRQPVPGQRGRIQFPAVEHRPAQPRRAELGEAPGARPAAAEADHGDRAEHLVAAGEVEFDAVTADVEEACALLRLLVGQRGQAGSRGSACSGHRPTYRLFAAGGRGQASPGLGSATNRHQLRRGLARHRRPVLNVDSCRNFLLIMARNQSHESWFSA